MRKYILTDPNGYTPSHDHLEPGTFVQADNAKSDEPIVRIITSGYDSPLLAVLETPVVSDNDNKKLFMLHTGSAAEHSKGAKTYIEVKEVPVPNVNLQQKVAFAIAAVSALYGNEDFRRWAEHWLSDKDRSRGSAHTLKEALKREVEAGSVLEELAAWGETAGSDEDTIQEQEDLEKRALHTAAAAELLADRNPDPDEVAGAVALALQDIEKYGEKVDFEKLSAKVINTEAVQ